MNVTRPEIPAWIVTVISLVGIIVLSALGHTIPTELTVIASAAGGGALGITGTGSSSSTTSSASSSDQVVAPPAS